MNPPSKARRVRGTPDTEGRAAMEVCLEGYLFVNFMMNLLILGLAARAIGRTRPARLVGAAALGAVYAALVYAPGCAILGSTVARVLIPALMAYVACGYGGIWRFTTNVAVTMAATMLFGGSALAMGYVEGAWNWRALGLTMLIGGALGLALTGRSRRRMPGWEVSVVIAANEVEVTLPALVDTGNRLREPISGQPVIVASENAVRALLPDGLAIPDAGEPPDRLPLGWRLVCFNALGERGFMLCFRPDKLQIQFDRYRQTRADIWVAVYPDELPGDAPVLVPLSASCIEGGNRKGSVKAYDRQSRLNRPM